ncbi:MAG: PhoH family protein [Flavobacteriales bacterium]|nr:PhoH family protein [Flavobacteriales bacterium]
MSEKTFSIEPIPPLEFFGVNERKLKTIAKYFPKLKLIARGQELKLIGDEDSVEEFEQRFKQFQGHFKKFGTLPILEIERLLLSEAHHEGEKLDDSVLVYGPAGNLIKARTPNQKKIVSAVDKDDMIFIIGPAGSGKTYTAVALAVRSLKRKEVKRIILTRPAVEAGESIGFLPGDMKEKLDPYLQPLYDALMDMLPPVKLAQYLETGVIQIAPLGFMRGRTLDHAFVILDEAQNATDAQTRMFLTRMGNSAKFIITGDVTQIDLPKKVQSGLRNAWNMLSGVKGISFIELGGSDIVRHPLVKRIVDIYAKSDEK